MCIASPKHLLRLSLWLIIFLIISQCTISAQSRITSNAEPFCDVISKIKFSIGYLNICTNVDSLAVTGTAFIIDQRGYLATCAHPFFDTTSRDSILLIPDTSRIYVKLETSDKFFRVCISSYRIDRDIVILKFLPNQAGLSPNLFIPVAFGETIDICEGLDIACTGYDLAGQTDIKFGRIYRRLTTHKGIISAVFAVGPADSLEFLETFQADMLINKGASGSPVYEVETGKVLGMVKGMRGRELMGIPISFGLADCVPSWSIIRVADNAIPPQSQMKAAILNFALFLQGSICNQ